MPDEARRIDDKLTGLEVAFARLEGKLDALITTKDDHEKRLRSLEQWRWTIVGGSLMASGGVAALVSRIAAGG